MAKSWFRVYNESVGDHVAVIEMDDDLLAPDVGILDHDTMTLRKLKGGGMYTLKPIDDFKVATLMRLGRIYQTIQSKPATLFSTNIARMDELIQAVGLLYGEVSFTLIENVDDMQKLLQPKHDYEPKKVTYKVMDELLKVLGVTPHECGEGCTHGAVTDDD